MCTDSLAGQAGSLRCARDDDTVCYHDAMIIGVPEPSSSRGGLDAARQRLEGKGAVPFDVSKAIAQNKAKEQSEMAARTKAMAKLDADIKTARDIGDTQKVRMLESQKLGLTQQSVRQFNTSAHSIRSQQGKIKGIVRQSMKNSGQ